MNPLILIYKIASPLLIIYKIKATGKLKHKTKQPLIMFMLSFSNVEDVNKILSIKYIMGIRIDVQSITKTKLIFQSRETLNGKV